jgi:subtilisin family serine protease
MASLIAGHGHGTGDGCLGIAPRARILPIRRGAAHTPLDKGEVAKGIRWAVDHGARVINLSLGNADSPPLRQAVDYALDRDVVVVAAVGLPGGLGRIPAPARIPGVVAVSGVDRNGNIAASASGPEVAIAAPAKDIVHATKGGGYSIGTGTSDATAIVSGVVALIRSKYPDLDAANVINRLIQTADDKGPPGRDERYGFGIVNPVRALTADVPRVDRNPLLGGADPTMSPTAPTQSESTVGSAPEAPPPAAQADSESPLIGIGAGLAGLVVVGATTLLLLRTSRNRGRSHVT